MLYWHIVNLNVTLVYEFDVISTWIRSLSSSSSIICWSRCYGIIKWLRHLDIQSLCAVIININKCVFSGAILLDCETDIQNILNIFHLRPCIYSVQ